MDFHAEAQQRFFEDTHSAVVARNTDIEKGIVVGEFALDGIQTHDFIRKGTCRELDPIAKPFVHYTPESVVATAGVGWLVVHIPSSPFGRILLGVLAVGEGANVTRNYRVGCY